jgi:xylulokinase
MTLSGHKMTLSGHKMALSESKMALPGHKMTLSGPREAKVVSDVGPQEKYVLAVDLGTGGPKVALVSMGGEIVGHEAARNEVLLLPGGGAEQDPEEWWRTITEGMRRLLGRGLVPVHDIVAISITSQWMGTVAVDEHGRHLMNAVIWLDGRGAPYASRVTGGALTVPGTGYGAFKLFKWLRLTGGVPSRTGKDPVGHILFIRHERPEVYRATYKFLEPMDYLTMRLTGRAVASFASVTGYWCTDNRDLGEGQGQGQVRYDEALVAACGLEPEKLPELVPTGSVIGRITAEVAAELGLPESVAVVTSTADTASAAIGAGAVDDYEAHLYIGTSSWLSCHVPFKRTRIRSNITSLPSGIPGRYWVATEQDAAGKCLSWLIENVLYPRDALADATPPADVLGRLNELARTVPAGSHGVLFAPWLNGERTPVDDPSVRGGWFNVSLTTDRAALVRAVFEGVALNARWMLAATEGFIAKERPDGFEHINFVGGGANSALWCQILADVLGRRIRQVKDPVLANVRGAGFSAAVALGHLGWEDIPGKVQIARVYEPDPANRATYDRMFAAFLELYRRTRGLYARFGR